jgi:hypothetical protein
MTDKEALKMALEALELAHPRFGIATEKYKQAITAIRARLEQPEQEPVAWMTQARNLVPISEFTEEEAKLYGWNALYLHPPQRTEENT